MSFRRLAPLAFLLACATFLAADDSPLPEETPDTWPAPEDELAPADPDEAVGPVATPNADAPPAARTPEPLTEEQIRKLIRNLESKSARERKQAQRMLESLPPDVLRKPLLDSLYSKSPGQRRYAAEALAQVRDNSVVRPLIARAVEDDVEDVRRAAVESLVTLAGRDIARAFLDELEGQIPRFRLNSFQALAWIGNPYAIGPLIRHTRYRAYGGGGPRAHIFVGEQFAYVKDYDVEVASNAAVADPIVGVVSSGTVLDVQVVRTEQIVDVYERVAAVDALRSITGQNFGEDTAAWSRWWEGNRAHVTADYDREEKERVDATKAQSLYAIGTRLEAAERFAEAMGKYKAVLERFPASARAAEAKARLSALEASPTVQRKVELARAEEECRRQLSLAETCLANGMREQAIEAARPIAERYPDTEWGRQAREWIRKAGGKAEEPERE